MNILCLTGFSILYILRKYKKKTPKIKQFQLNLLDLNMNDNLIE